MAMVNGPVGAEPVLKAVHAMSRSQGDEKKAAFAYLQSFQKSVSIPFCAGYILY